MSIISNIREVLTNETYNNSPAQWIFYMLLLNKNDPDLETAIDYAHQHLKGATSDQRLVWCHHAKDLEQKQLHPFFQNLEISRIKSTKIDLKNAINLQELKLSNMYNLKSLAGIEGLPKLEKLTLCMLPQLKTAGIENQLTMLGVEPSKTMASISTLKNLKFLSVSEMRQIYHFKDLGPLHVLENLEHLELRWMRNIVSLHGLGRLKSLKTLVIHGCPRLTESDVHSNLPPNLESDPLLAHLRLDFDGTM